MGFNERSLDRALAMRLVYNISLPNKNTKKSVFLFPIYLKIRKMVEIILIYFCKFLSPGFLYFYSLFLTGLPIGSPKEDSLCSPQIQHYHRKQNK